MKRSVVVITVISAAVVSALVTGLLRSGGSAKKAFGDTPARVSSSGSPPVSAPAQAESLEAQLTEHLKLLCRDVSGDIGVAVIHVETGRTALLDSAKQLPLYSVFKLPLAVTVLREVEAKRLTLDKKVQVSPEDVAPGTQFNTDLWRRPVEKTIAELVEFSIVRSDNTSSDKLLQLVGGPAAVTRQMRALGFSNIEIQYTTREFALHRDKPNKGTASDLAHLLAQLQRGELLQTSHATLLLDFMARAMTGGERRLRADLPLGTPVAEKTGTGAPGTSTNDVGLITLPEGKGHVAIAVLVNGSKSPVASQEKLIAQLARAAYDSFIASSSPVR